MDINNLNPNYTFDNFIIENENRFAYVAAHNVAEENELGKSYNPLYIYGKKGAGKTHLLNAIGNYIFEKDKFKNILYIDSIDFVKELKLALKNNEYETFIRKYENLDVLLLDDIQFLANEEKAEQVFIYLFDKLHREKGKTIVISADKVSKKIKGLNQRINNRCDIGLVTDIRKFEDC